MITSNRPNPKQPGSRPNAFEGPSGYERLPASKPPTVEELNRRLSARRTRRMVATGTVVIALVVLGLGIGLRSRGKSSPQAPAPETYAIDSPSPPLNETQQQAWPYRVNLVWSEIVPIVKEDENGEAHVVGWQSRDYTVPIDPRALREDERTLIHDVLFQPQSKGIEL